MELEAGVPALLPDGRVTMDESLPFPNSVNHERLVSKISPGPDSL